MKRDLCTNPILASQLPHTAVSMYPQTQKPGCNTCMYAALLVTPHFNLVLKCDLRHTALLCLHLFPHLFAIAFLSRPPSPQPHLPFSSPSPSPIHYYPHTFIWYSCSPPPIIPSVFFTSASVVPLSAMEPAYHIDAFSGGWVVLSCRQILMSSYGDRTNAIKSSIRLYSLLGLTRLYERLCLRVM